MLTLLLTFVPLNTVSAVTQKQVYEQSIGLYDVSVPDCISGSGLPGGSTGGATATDSTYHGDVPSGTDPETQIWNFFTNTVNLSPVATAGIMGNMLAESHFNPAAEEVSSGYQGTSTPGSWADMSLNNINTGWFSGNIAHPGGGVGLVQWDGGRRPAYINYAADHGADKKNIVPQLNYVWYELNHGYTEVLTGGKDYKGVYHPGIQTATDPGVAALTFHALYEISADDASKIQGRMDNAAKIYDKYSNGNTTASVCGGNAGSLSPECATAVGNARIFCAAEQYDPISYREDGTPSTGHGSIAQWHSKYCPSINASCAADCSGLVNIAVFDVYGVELYENTTGERGDIGKYWQVVSFSQVKAGDLIQPFGKTPSYVPQHVEIVGSVAGTVVHTFGAHTDGRPQPDQVGQGKFDLNKYPNSLFLRYIGPGAQAS
jgi:hypothetical protein